MARSRDRHGRVRDGAGRYAPDPRSLTAAYRDQRLRLLKAQADLAEDQARHLRNRLVPRAEVEAAWEVITQIVRERLSVVPEAVTARLTSVKTAADAERVMREVIYQAMDDISKTRVEVENR